MTRTPLKRGTRLAPVSRTTRTPSPVLVTDANGVMVATIDPLTRKRTNLNGDAATILTPQGWALHTGGHISWPAHGRPPREVLEPLERTRWGKIKNRESGRIGQGNGGGRPRKARV